MKYTVVRKGGLSYEIDMEPGQYLDLRPDESLVVPQPPQVDVTFALDVLQALSRRVSKLEELVAALTRHHPNNIYVQEILDPDGRSPARKAP